MTITTKLTSGDVAAKLGCAQNWISRNAPKLKVGELTPLGWLFTMDELKVLRSAYKKTKKHGERKSEPAPHSSSG